MKGTRLILCLVLVSGFGCNPKESEPEKFLFYLPGGIVLEQGGNPVSSHFGKYHYDEIVDSLRGRGLHVISDITAGTADSVYVNRISGQVDSLLYTGVLPENITVLGASAGAYITLDIAMKLKNPKIKYAILGMCWEDTYKHYEGKPLCGKFLSIYEASDPHGTCSKIFEVAGCVSHFIEIRLDVGNSHAFLYRPHKEWVEPLIEWITQDEATVK